MSHVEELILRKKELVWAIREFVSGQVEFSRQIPFAALELNGRHHWSQKLKCAYAKMKWRVTDFVAIDLRTGNLLGPDDYILPLNVRCLDPESILCGLLRKIQNEEFNPGLERPSDWDSQKEILRGKLNKELGGKYGPLVASRMS